MTQSDAIRDIAAAWLAAPTDKPLTLVKDAGGVQVYQGSLPARKTQAVAARFFGVSINTFRQRYIDSGLLRIGSDRRIGRVAATRLLQDLDGRD